MDSNQRIGESKSPALPLGYTPVWVGIDWPAQIPKAFLPDKLSAKRGIYRRRREAGIEPAGACTAGIQYLRYLAIGGSRTREMDD